MMTIIGAPRRRFQGFSGIAVQCILLSLLLRQSIAQETPEVDYPHLSGQHFRITVVEEADYVDIQENINTGELSFSGYLIDVLREVAREDRANFTYTLLTPSGYGSGCDPRLDRNFSNSNGTDDEELFHPEAYHQRYRPYYKCGESDVNDRPLSNYSTDFYLGVYYITPQRLLVSRFTVPYNPPTLATIGMIGSVTHVDGVDSALAKHPDKYKFCAYEGTAYMETLQVSFPHINFVGVVPDVNTIYEIFASGKCDLLLGTYPNMQGVVQYLHQQDQCTVNGEPIGVIGKPLDYGLNHFAFGIRDDLPENVLGTLNFWLQALMACFPQDPGGFCPQNNGGGSLSRLFEGIGGTGMECGYVQYPVPESKALSPGVIAAIVIVPLVVVLLCALLLHFRQMKKQEERMKKRFIQQLARNINIGESAKSLSAEQLSEAYKHIGGEDGLITKDDLARWLNDLHMEFMSEHDFNRLWDTMDIDGNGVVEPMQFFHFLSECGPQFKQVSQEFAALPKSERLKLAARRLSNISTMGEEGVAKLERRNKRSRQPISVNAASTVRNSSMRSLRDL